MENGARKYFTFYRSFYEQIRSCEDKAVRLEMYEVFLDYAFNKKEPDFKKGRLNELTRFFWMGAKPVLDKSWKGFDNGSKPKANGKQNTSKTQATPSIDKDNRIRNIDIDIEGEKEDGIFCPPALEDVLCYYFSTHGTKIEDSVAKKFINYYAARGWKMGQVMMTDWQAAFDSWCDKEMEFNHKHAYNDANDKSATNNSDAELGQLREEQRAAEARLAGEGPGADGPVW